MLRECPLCLTSYKPKRYTQKYCSGPCQRKSLKRSILKECAREGCYTQFSSRISENRKYCSKTCAAVVNNSLFPKRGGGESIICPRCNRSKVAQAYFCQSCYPIVRQEEKIAKWLSGEWAGGSSTKLSDTVRKYLLKQASYACVKCEIKLFHPSDGSSVLEINHIDGNGSNHSPANLEVLCPNCHALTPSYRGRNQGHGRPQYYLRKTIIR